VNVAARSSARNSNVAVRVSTVPSGPLVIVTVSAGRAEADSAAVSATTVAAAAASQIVRARADHMPEASSEPLKVGLKPR
jgi:hypothetical protein